MHKAVTGRTEAKKLLSRRRQSNYSLYHFKLEVMPLHILLDALSKRSPKPKTAELLIDD